MVVNDISFSIDNFELVSLTEDTILNLVKIEDISDEEIYELLISSNNKIVKYLYKTFKVKKELIELIEPSVLLSIYIRSCNNYNIATALLTYVIIHSDTTGDFITNDMFNGDLFNDCTITNESAISFLEDVVKSNNIRKNLIYRDANRFASK